MDGTLGGLEALLSWHHPKLGKVPAGQFIPVAEDNGMIVPIGTWVLNEACRQCAAWQKLAPPGVMMAVNVSAVQLSRPDFLDVVAGALDDNHLAPRLIELEVTESAVMRDIDQSVRTLTRLRKLGVSISIDDFGTGYSSLSYLQRLPVDTLKIDRSFLEGSYSPRPPLPLIEAIVRLAHAMGLTVVGEGVESKEQLELLRRAGCDKVQGHLFGRPLAPTGVERLLRNRERIAPVRQRRQTA
jgi:EAL domain-containing protein (putative c-di-GMP-specific phosphodiesterase class I)